MDKILDLGKRYSALPQQRTDAWKLLRNNGIGGSSISAFTGSSQFYNINTLITNRVTPTTPTPASHFNCNWGTLFEPVAKHLAQLEYSCTILHDNIFCYSPDDCFYYSPDGIAVVSGEKFKNQPINPAPEFNVLFEFKCPVSRKINATSEVPQYYIDQVQMGLDYLRTTTGQRVCDFGLLYEVPIKPSKTLDSCDGFIGFYTHNPTPEQYFTHFTREPDANSINIITDKQLLTLMLHEFVSNRIHVQYYYNTQHISQFKDYTLAKGGRELFILPWKLRQQPKSTFVPYCAGFLDALRPIVKQTLQQIEQIKP